MNDIKVRIISAVNEIDVQRVCTDNFNLAEFSVVLNVKNKLDENQLIIVERILKKIDGVKVLYLEYKLELSKRASDVILPEKALKVLLLKLLYLCVRNKDLKILNTLLKVRDNNNFKVDNVVLGFIQEVKLEVMG